MDLFCVRCGAAIAADSAVCGACGLPRSASLPPGTAERSAVLEPGIAATELWPAPVPVPVPGYGVATPEQHHQVQVRADPAVRPHAGAVDVVLLVVGAVVALGIGFFLNDHHLTRVQHWLVPRACFTDSCSFNAHDLLVAAVAFSPFAVAAGVALASRIPGAGVLVAVLGQVPLVVFGSFAFDADWELGIALGAFLLADVVLLLTRRGVPIALLCGLLAGAGTAAYPLVTFQRSGALRFVTDHAPLTVEYVAVPVGLVLLASVLGGVVATLRGR